MKPEETSSCPFDRCDGMQRAICVWRMSFNVSLSDAQYNTLTCMKTTHVHRLMVIIVKEWVWTCILIVLWCITIDMMMMMMILVETTNHSSFECSRNVLMYCHVMSYLHARTNGMHWQTLIYCHALSCLYAVIHNTDMMKDIVLHRIRSTHSVPVYQYTLSYDRLAWDVQFIDHIFVGLSVPMTIWLLKDY
jgi:hypothetical protein